VNSDLEISRASSQIYPAKGWTCLVILGQKRLGNSRNLIIEEIGTYANSSTYIGHRWTSFEKSKQYLA
jgi:hypothetical protein